MRSLYAVLAVVVASGLAWAAGNLPIGSQCRAGFDTCVKDAACRGGYCVQTRNIPRGGSCQPGLGDSCAAGLMCCSLQCVDPGPGGTCARN